jgi:hypothetical protein
MASETLDVETWKLSSLVAYYDESNHTLATRSTNLATLNADDQQQALAAVVERVASAIGQLDNDAISNAALSMIDDLYRAACTIIEWGPPQQQYVAAVWGTAFELVSQRGYTVRYVVENTWPDGLVRPIDVFPSLFGLAGFVYLCPHQAAASLPEAALAPRTVEGLSNTIEEGRYIVGEAIKQLSETNRHLVYLEADLQPSGLGAILEMPETPGVIEIFRNEAPIPGSKVTVKRIPLESK